MNKPDQEKLRRDRAGGKLRDAPDDDRAELGRSVERERATIRPDPPRDKLPGGGDVIR